MMGSRMLATLMLAAVCSASASIDPIGNNFDIQWSTIDGGGGTSNGGQFELIGTIGQHDASVLSNIEYEISGGFWVTTTEACTADLNGDGTVGTNDLLILFAFWGPCGDCNNCPADLNGDCIVNTSDLLELFANWGPCIL